ncbi:hypothetical protein [Treponema socranskii]|uniref:hypothetical protein n=1 Tax=Treponema socranskii TaxID=53419 RepID=UPI003D6F5F02
MQISQNTIGTPPSPFPIYEKLFNFIDSCLYDFRPLSKTKKELLIMAEDDITEDLVDFFETKQDVISALDYSFRFTNQSKKGPYKMDIGVKLGRKYIASNRAPFCWIEAKRLPTPKSGNSRDEREYVIVSQEKNNGKKRFKGNGGIQRFKEGKYAPDHQYAIMIGYIQEQDATFWLKTINNWIKDLIKQTPEVWNESDLLKPVSGKKQRYFSVHNRKELKEITLQHFWIQIS